MLDGRYISNMFQGLEYNVVDFLDADFEQYEQLYNVFNENLTEFKKYYSDDAKWKKKAQRIKYIFPKKICCHSRPNACGRD